jgi:hypothetical protein
MLSRQPAHHVVTNLSLIKDFVGSLKDNDNTARIANAPTRRGHTYHVLLFQQTNHTVMHFRVFEPIDTNTVWTFIVPRSHPGFAYMNKEILPWIKAHVKFPEAVK